MNLIKLFKEKQQAICSELTAQEISKFENGLFVKQLKEKQSVFNVKNPQEFIAYSSTQNCVIYGRK